MEKFRDFLKDQLSHTGMAEDTIESLLDEEGLAEYQKAFTHKSVDPVNNYEFYELVGDKVYNYCAARYVRKRFSIQQIEAANMNHRSEKEKSEGLGVNVVNVYTRMIIHVVSGKMMAVMGMKRGFHDHIRVGEEAWEHDRNSIVEDCMEAFIGVTSELIDQRHGEGEMIIGVTIVYNFIKNLLDEVDIPFTLPDLVDDKTKLKQSIYDKYWKKNLGRQYKQDIASEETRPYDEKKKLVTYSLITPAYMELTLARIVTPTKRGLIDFPRESSEYRYYSEGQGPIKKKAELAAISSGGLNYMSSLAKIRDIFDSKGWGVPVYVYIPSHGNHEVHLISVGTSEPVLISKGYGRSMHKAVEDAAINGKRALDANSTLNTVSITLPDMSLIKQPKAPVVTERSHK